MDGRVKEEEICNKRDTQWLMATSIGIERDSSELAMDKTAGMDFIEVLGCRGYFSSFDCLWCELSRFWPTWV